MSLGVGVIVAVAVLGTTGSAHGSLKLYSHFTHAGRTSALAITDLPRPGGILRSQLIAHPGTWTGVKPLSYAYAWKQCYQPAELDNWCFLTGTGKYFTMPTGPPVLYLSVRATGADGDTRAYLSEPIEAPSGTALADVELPRLFGQAAVGETLEATEGLWNGPVSTQFTFTWWRCVPNDRCYLEQGFPEPDQYVVSAADAGASVYAQVYARDPISGQDVCCPATPALSIPGTPPQPPSNTSPPTIIGQPTVGQTLMIDPGQWTGNPVFSYQWRRCTPDQTSCSNILGASGPQATTYVVQLADVGYQLTVDVTATNAAGTGYAPSPPTSTVTSDPIGDVGDPCMEHVVIYGMRGLGANTAYAAINEISLRDETFATCLQSTPDYAASGQTTRLHLGGVQNNWAEIGWMIRNFASGKCTENTGSGHCISVFTEWSLNGVTADKQLFNPAGGSGGNVWPAICVEPGRSDVFDAEHYETPQGPNDPLTRWMLREDCKDGVGYRTALITGQTGYSTGVAEGEGFERSDKIMTLDGRPTSSSSMYASHTNMQYADSNWQLRGSTGLGCRNDNDTIWDASIVNGAAFDLVASPTIFTCINPTN